MTPNDSVVKSSIESVAPVKTNKNRKRGGNNEINDKHLDETLH